MLLPKRKRTLSIDPMAVVTRFVEAANRHDAEGIEACLHPDFESIQPIHPSRNFRGSRQVRRNWQAIFDAEPGFRLTMLRSASHYDEAWVELHGAGRAAEVAGVIVFGVDNGRLRWARIYSELVEQAILPTDGTAGAASPVEQEEPATSAVEASESARPVFEVIQGEKTEPAVTADAGAGEGAPSEADAPAADTETLVEASTGTGDDAAGGVAESEPEPATAALNGELLPDGEADSGTEAAIEISAALSDPAAADADGDRGAIVDGAIVEGAIIDAAESPVEPGADEDAPPARSKRTRKPKSAAGAAKTRRSRKKDA